MIPKNVAVNRSLFALLDMSDESGEVIERTNTHLRSRCKLNGKEHLPDIKEYPNYYGLLSTCRIMKSGDIKEDWEVFEEVCIAEDCVLADNGEDFAVCRDGCLMIAEKVPPPQQKEAQDY
ncbi:hypothetical protein IFM89_014781 [Coptis chinensis]|uniref:Uncharacterized protein n=1 Tax=Coptis chinensis TaxID=261450 RepID=A0A835MBF2_9MAGN|nr:hypothetical protein IFM89_014781 [Coptis chinensis]